jgi:Transposase IS200 like
LHAFVLMPEHVHLLLTPVSDVTLERAIQLIKGGYSRAFGLEFRGREVWQRGFTDHRVRDRGFRPASGVYPSESGETGAGRQRDGISLLLRVSGVQTG